MNSSEQLVKLYFESLEKKDFKVFAGFCRIYSDFKNDFIFLRHDNWTYAQKQFEKERTGRDIVLKPRRIGFTTLELARDLFFALTNPGSTVMIVAQEFGLAKKAIQDIKNFVDYLKELETKLGTKLIPNVKSWNMKEIIFDTNSKIIGEVAKNQESAADRTGRGTGITRLHCTEVAFWSYPDLTMKSLLIAAKTAEEIVIESTPNGASGYFFDTYYKVKEGSKELSKWKAHFFPWYTHSEYSLKFFTKHEKEYFSMEPQNDYEYKLIHDMKITKEQLNWWRQTVAESSTGIDSILQEFPIDEASCFRTKSQTFLDQQDFEYLEKNIKEPNKKVSIEDYLPGIPLRDSFIHIWKEPTYPSDKFILAADVSYGREQDYSTICIIDHRTGEIAATFQNNKISPSEFGKLIDKLGRYYNDALVAVEIQAAGKSTIDTLEGLHYWNLYKHSNKDYYGFNTSVNNRTEMFNLFQQMIKERDPQIVDINIVKECRTLIFKDGKIQSTKTSHDDNLLAFMIAQKVRQEYPTSVFVGYTSVKSSHMADNNIIKTGLGKGYSSVRMR